MNIYTLAAFTAVPCIVSVASAATYEEYAALFDEQIACATEMVNILASVKDKESADAAAPKVDALAKQLVAVDAKLDALGDPSPEVAEQIEAMLDSREEEIMGVIEALFNAGMNIAINEYYGSETLQAVIENLADEDDGDEE